MSIATLKRKTGAKYHNNSVNHPQFSLNGVHRSQGFVGQTMLSRSLPRTLFNGATPRGAGGTNGQYRVGTTVQSGVNYSETPTTMKPSVVSTRGMIAMKYRWALRPHPTTSVKPDSNQNFNTEKDYIDYVHKKALADYNTCTGTKVGTRSVSNCDSTTKQLMRNNSFIAFDIKNSACQSLTKPASEYTSISQSEHLYNLHSKCQALDSYQIDIATLNKTCPVNCIGMTRSY